MRKNIFTWVVLALVGWVPSIFADVTVSSGGTVGASWPGSPSVVTYSVPNTPSGGTRVPESFDNGRVVSQTFTPTTNMTLSGITISTVGAGSGTVALSLHLFDINNPHSLPGSYNLATDATADLFGGGAGLSFFPIGSGSDIFQQFTFSNGATNDQIALQAGHLYAFEVWGVSGQTGLLNWIRGSAGISVYPDGDGYNATGGASSNLRTQLAGGSRDTVMAVYALAAVPEPTTIAFIGFVVIAAGVVGYRQRRARLLLESTNV